MDYLKKNQISSWDTMLKHVPRSVVFLDNVCAECLHWSIGVDAVFDAGAVAIKDFTAFECGDICDKRAVFVLNNLLNDNVQDTICDIVKASQFHQCTIIYCSKPLLGSEPSSDEIPAFDQIQQRVQYYLKDKPSRCDVVCLPLSDFSFCSNLFVTPGFSQLFPLLLTDIKRIKALSSKVYQSESCDLTNDIYFEMLPQEIQQKYKWLIGSLDSLCQRLEVNEDIYCIGATSQLIATQLAALPSAKIRRRSASKRASLVVVDRTLDLAGPVGHSNESLADKIFASLPRLQGHTADVGIDMSMFYSKESFGKPNVLSPGCLAQPQDKNCVSLLNTLVMSKAKESLMEVNRQIVDVIMKEKMQRPGKLGRGLELLKSHLNLFSAEKTSESIERNCGLLQLSVACLNALQNDNQNVKQQLLEKIIIQSSSNYEESSACSHILKAFNNSEKSDESDAVDVLQSLVFLYSVHGTSEFSYKDEKDMKQLLKDYISRDKQQGNLNPYFECGVDEIFQKLKSIGIARENLKQFRDVIEDGNDVFPSTYKCFLQHLIEQILDSSKPDLPDLLHRSTGLRDRIKTSFRLFMNVSKPRPSEHPLLIIYVIGGITSSEVRAINEVSAKATQEILLGSTCLLKPNDVIEKIFNNDLNNSNV